MKLNEVVLCDIHEMSRVTHDVMQRRTTPRRFSKGASAIGVLLLHLS
jgi:hypothetical protein